MARKKPDDCPQSVAGVPFGTFARRIVRFETDGEERFGCVCSLPAEEVRKCAARGLLLIADEVFPGYHRLSPGQVTVVKELPWDADDPLNRHRKKLLTAAQKASKKVEGFGPGKLFNIPVGDGRAWYVVTKATAKTAMVEWRGYHWDNWRDPVLDWGGAFPRAVIERLVRRYEGLQRIFGAGTGNKSVE